MLQTLARKDDIASLTNDYGLVIADECHHIPAAAFELKVWVAPGRDTDVEKFIVSVAWEDDSDDS
jgi:hypothetical protein